MNFIFFDLDGTLTDPYVGITESVVYALASFGIPRPEERVLRACIGPPLKESFEEFFGMDELQAQLSVEKFRERYHAIGWEENVPYDGVQDCLAALRSAGKTLAVATGKPTLFAEKILKRFGLLEYFSAVVGSEFDGTLTQKREEIARAMELVGATNGAMIGDRKYDIEGGKSLGLFTAGVTFGYAEEGELEAAQAEILFPSFSAIKAYFLTR